MTTEPEPVGQDVRDRVEATARARGRALRRTRRTAWTAGGTTAGVVGAVVVLLVPGRDGPRTIVGVQPTTVSSPTPLSTRASLVETPASEDSRSSSPARPCTSAQLTVSPGASLSSGNGRGRQVVFRNTSSGPCTLSGAPVVTYAGSQSNPRSSTATQAGEQVANPAFGFAPAPTQVVLGAGGTAASWVAWDSTAPQCSETATRMVVPPGQSDALVLVDPDGFCGATFAEPVMETPYRPDPQVDVGPTCSGSQLQVEDGVDGAAAGHVGVSFVLHNTSTTACTMKGYPSLVVVGDDGSRTVAQQLSPGEQSYTLRAAPAPVLVGLRPGGHAVVWASSTSGAEPCGTGRPSGLALAPPGSSLERYVPGNRVGRCDLKVMAVQPPQFDGRQGSA